MRSKQLPAIFQADRTQPRARKLQTSSSKIDTGLKKIALDVLTLVRLREAMLMHQAVECKNGPLAGRRQEMLTVRTEAETRIRLHEKMRETDLSEPAKPGPVRRSTSSWSSEGDDDDGHIPTSDHGVLDRR